MAFNIPILFLVFNRPEYTHQVLQRIREIKPKYLFVGADGPRISHPGDQKKCEDVREIILNNIDWKCEVKTLFRDENLGCGRGPAEAINWFFENVEEGIILEDDCLPEIFFFQFCSQLIEHYRHDNSVMHIGGSNFQNGKNMNGFSYYFSAYSHNWGWATWKRSWSKFRYQIPKIDVINLSLNLKEYGFNKTEINFWIETFEKSNLAGQTDIWDYQWLYTIWLSRGLCIVPRVNLVRNIGFDNQGTHTTEAHNFLSIPSESLNAIEHPIKRGINIIADHYTFEKYYLVRPSITKRVLSILRSLLKKLLTSSRRKPDL